jgi:hypothetical protein
MNRPEKRRNDRAKAKAAARKVPVVLLGDGIVAAPLGHQFEAKGGAQLPPKIGNEHRWIATAAYVMDVDQVRAAHDPDTLKFLDEKNLMYLAVGCWDCEQTLGAIRPDTPCPAPADD